MPAPASLAPPTFLQFGPEGTSMIRLEEITLITRECIDITDERRER